MDRKEILFQKIKRDNNIRVSILIISFIFCLILKHLKIIPSLIFAYITASLCLTGIIIIYFLLSKNIANSYMDFGISVFDYFLITILIYFTGGIESSFYLIYIITILIEVMDLVDKRHMVFDIIASLLFYAIVIILMNYKNLTNTLLFHLSIREIFILIMGIIALQYANIIIKSKEEIIKVNKEKVETIQELAAGVLHEIRNPLSGIKLLTQGLDQEINQDDPKKEYVEEILKEVDKLSQFSADFLNYARPFEVRLSKIKLKYLIEEVLSIFVPKINEKIKISQEVSADLEIFADKDKISEVLINIIDNAFQSIEEKGIINIQAKLVNANNIKITISDNGCGISEANIDNIFKPFFTLKNKGTGLGLSICKKIIDAHKGSIQVNSKYGVGTTFNILLPLKVSN